MDQELAENMNARLVNMLGSMQLEIIRLQSENFQLRMKLETPVQAPVQE